MSIYKNILGGFIEKSSSTKTIVFLCEIHYLDKVELETKLDWETEWSSG